jgi:hypothetical protein
MSAATTGSYAGLVVTVSRASISCIISSPMNFDRCIKSKHFVVVFSGAPPPTPSFPPNQPAPTLPPAVPQVPSGTPSSIGKQTMTFIAVLPGLPAGQIGIGVSLTGLGQLGGAKVPTPGALGPQPILPDLGTARVTAKAVVTSIKLG